METEQGAVWLVYIWQNFGTIRYRHGYTITVLIHFRSLGTIVMLDRRDLPGNAGGITLLTLSISERFGGLCARQRCSTCQGEHVGLCLYNFFVLLCMCACMYPCVAVLCLVLLSWQTVRDLYPPNSQSLPPSKTNTSYKAFQQEAEYSFLGFIPKNKQTNK